MTFENTVSKILEGQVDDSGLGERGGTDGRGRTVAIGTPFSLAITSSYKKNSCIHDFFVIQCYRFYSYSLYESDKRKCSKKSMRFVACVMHVTYEIFCENSRKSPSVTIKSQCILVNW